MTERKDCHIRKMIIEAFDSDWTMPGIVSELWLLQMQPDFWSEINLYTTDEIEQAYCPTSFY